MAVSVFQQWATAVLNGIGAPVNATNIATLAKWRGKEGTSAQYNYLATTQAASGATNFNSVGVKNYATVDSGAQATAQTLQSGLYGNVLAMFRNSVPAASWSAAARYDLDTWAHGPSGVHNGAYSNFLGGAAGSTSGGGPNIGAAASTLINDVKAGGLAPTNPLDPLAGVGSAISGFGTTVNNDVRKVLYFAGGGMLILVGVVILALILLKGPAQAAAGVAANVTPQGRAVKAVAGAAKPAAKPEADYRAGGKVLEITPAARRRLAARQRGEAV